MLGLNFVLWSPSKHTSSCVSYPPRGKMGILIWPAHVCLISLHASPAFSDMLLWLPYMECILCVIFNLHPWYFSLASIFGMLRGVMWHASNMAFVSGIWRIAPLASCSMRLLWHAPLTFAACFYTFRCRR